MKVALIGDVHANLPALEAVLDHAYKQDIQAVWNVGDLVGYGAFPEQVIQRLREENVLSTIGDYDNQVLRFKKRRERWRKSKPLEEYRTLEWTYGQLTKKSRKYLRFLSQEMRMRIKGHRVLLTHRCPGPSEPPSALTTLAREADADLIVCGRSHKPWSRHKGGTWFINPGSVGLPVDGDPRAGYALLQIGTEGCSVKHHRVEYDVESIVAAIQDSSLPASFADIFRLGLDLNSVLLQET